MRRGGDRALRALRCDRCGRLAVGLRRGVLRRAIRRATPVSGAPTSPGAPHLGSPPSSNWGQAQPWSIVTAGKIITGSGAVLCSVVVSVATT
jgi:hypothetical protein